MSVTRSATEIECALYGESQYVATFPGPETVTLEVEVIGVDDASSLAGAMNSRSSVTVLSTHVGGTYRVLGLQIDEPLDGIVSYTATLKRSL